METENEPMEEQEVPFCNILQRLGFSLKARNAIVEEGIDSMVTMFLFTDKDLEKVMQQIVKTTSSKKQKIGLLLGQYK